MLELLNLDLGWLEDQKFQRQVIGIQEQNC